MFRHDSSCSLFPHPVALTDVSSQQLPRLSIGELNSAATCVQKVWHRAVCWAQGSRWRLDCEVVKMLFRQNVIIDIFLWLGVGFCFESNILSEANEAIKSKESDVLKINPLCSLHFPRLLISWMFTVCIPCFRPADPIAHQSLPRRVSISTMKEIRSYCIALSI